MNYATQEEQRPTVSAEKRARTRTHVVGVRELENSGHTARAAKTPSLAWSVPAGGEREVYEREEGGPTSIQQNKKQTGRGRRGLRKAAKGLSRGQ